MSLKFERDVVRETTRPDAGALLSKALSTASDASLSAASSAAADTPARHAHDVVKHVDELADSVGDFAKSVGESLTGGKTPTNFKGPKGYLMAYIRELENNPLRTKMLTAGVLAGAQEYIASWLAGDMDKDGSYMTPRVPQMAAYGALVSAPLGHVLIWCLQRAFRGRTSVKAKVMQILVSNLVMAPIQNAVYLIVMALIAGARSRRRIRATLKVSFWKAMKVSWLTSPLALAFAQKFLPDHLWVPFFNLVAFAIGIHINVFAKKKRLAALLDKYYTDKGSDRETRDRSERDRSERDRRPRPPPSDRREAAAPGNEHHSEYAPSHMGGPPSQY